MHADQLPLCLCPPCALFPLQFTSCQIIVYNCCVCVCYSCLCINLICYVNLPSTLEATSTTRVLDLSRTAYCLEIRQTSFTVCHMGVAESAWLCQQRPYNCTTQIHLLVHVPKPAPQGCRCMAFCYSYICGVLSTLHCRQTLPGKSGVLVKRCSQYTYRMIDLLAGFPRRVRGARFLRSSL